MDEPKVKRGMVIKTADGRKQVVRSEGELPAGAEVVADEPVLV